MCRGCAAGLAVLSVALGCGRSAATTVSTAANEGSSLFAQAIDDAFSAYVIGRGRTYGADAEEYAMRKSLFATHFAKVEAHNAKPGQRWTAAVNDFADRTPEEKISSFGWRHIGSPHASAQGASLAEVVHSAKTARQPSQLPEEMSWMNLSSAKRLIRSQGGCGSCWAVTTTGLLEAHREIQVGEVVSYSSQDLIDCTANPQHCGGTGGCEGATVELALDQIIKGGIHYEKHLPYKGSNRACSSVSTGSSNEGVGNEGLSSFADTRAARRSASSLGLYGFTTLPQNREEPLVRALVDHGPVAISVAASGWMYYGGGVYDACERNAILNHAVMLWGFTKNTWLIRNSWGRGWGERGFIRLHRHDDEEAFCGIDNQPEKGVGCDGGPSEVRVCGSCGILYDNVIPCFDEDCGGAPGSRILSRKPRAAEHGMKVRATVGSDAVPRLVREA